MSFSATNTCVYTCLLGGYETLNEQPLAWASKIPFYCLTDDPSLKSDSWKIIVVDPLFPADSVRSQRSLKIRPPVGGALPPVECSLYLDNSVLLARPPEEILESCLGEASLAIPNHSFRERVIDEFQEVTQLGFDDQNRIFEQLNHYALSAPQVLDERPYFTGMLMRRHHDAGVRRLMEIWHAHVMRYSRRDQLSLNLAAHLSGIQPVRLDLDNLKSAFHTWPVVTGRKRNLGLRDPLTTVMPLALRVQQLERELVEARKLLQGQPQLAQHCHDLKAEVARLGRSRQELSRELRERKKEVRAMRSSLSWRLTRPLRNVLKRLGSAAGRPAAEAPTANVPPAPPVKGREPGEPVSVTSTNGRQIFTLPGDLRAQELERHEGILNPRSLQMWQMLLASAPWTHIVDAGANYGEMLVLADLPAGATVIAVEPQPEIARCLHQTCFAAGLNVQIVTKALSDQEGNLPFQTDLTWSGMSTMERAIDPSHQMVETVVPTTTLDALLPAPLAGTPRRLLCKIDVEGHEVAVLKGGLVTFSACTDYAILIEALHLDEASLDWLLCHFQVALLDTTTAALVQVRPPTGKALKSLLTSGSYYPQDLVLRSPSHLKA